MYESAQIRRQSSRSESKSVCIRRLGRITRIFGVRAAFRRLRMVGFGASSTILSFCASLWAMISCRICPVWRSREGARDNERIIFLLAIGSVMAFGVIVASIGTVKRTSATSMGVMANRKQ
eukprot:UN00243